MRKALLGLSLVIALVLPASAAGAAHGGISGALYDTTCADGCGPVCPPPCSTTEVICAQTQRAIVCPLQKSAPAVPKICLQSGCGVQYPLYEGDGATITVRRAGSATAFRTLTPNKGRFNVPLGPGRYVLQGYVALPCWSGEKVVVTVQPGHWTTGTEVQVHNGCVVHPETAG